MGLSEVTFVAPPSSITAVMSLEDTERKLVLKMIGCPPSTGEYDGQVYFSDGYTMSDVGYVSTVWPDYMGLHPCPVLTYRRATGF